jgi:hypothetical protein
MKTAIKQRQSRKSAIPDKLEQTGPMMVWNGPRSAEEVEMMSDWVTKRKQEMLAANLPVKNE